MSNEPNWLEFFEDRERRYAEYYLDFAEQNARRDPEAYEQLEAESGNLLRVADWLRDNDEAEEILKLARALWEESDFMRTRGFMQRGLPLLEWARAAACQIGDLEAEFLWLEALAFARYSVSDFDSAQALYEQTLSLSQDINNLQFIAQAQLGMGRLLMDMGQLDRSAVWLKQALENYRQIENYAGEIETLVALGNLLSLQGDSTEAVAYLEKGLPLAQARQDRHNETSVYYALGYAAAVAKNWIKAISYFQVATDMAREIGNRFFEIRGLHNLGEAWLALGDAQQAVTLLESALACQEISDDILTKSFTHFYLAKAYHFLNLPDKVLNQLGQVYPYLLETRDAPITGTFAVEAAWMMVDNYLKQNNVDLARNSLKDVLTLAPDNMVELRHAAKILLHAIESGEYGHGFEDAPLKTFEKLVREDEGHTPQ